MQIWRVNQFACQFACQFSVPTWTATAGGLFGCLAVGAIPAGNRHATGASQWASADVPVVPVDFGGFLVGFAVEGTGQSEANDASRQGMELLIKQRDLPLCGIFTFRFLFFFLLSYLGRLADS